MRFDLDKLETDMAVKGWLKVDLAAASNLSTMTMTRLFRGETSNPRTWARVAEALGKPLKRYLRRAA